LTYDIVPNQWQEVDQGLGDPVNVWMVEGVWASENRFETVRAFQRHCTALSISGYDRGRIAPIEQIIDPDGQSLNIGVPGSEGINQKARGHRRVFQSNKLAVNPGAPVGGKRPFDASASHPTTGGSGFAEGCERRVDGGTGLNPATATFGVK
jgi:hypothetical protein